MQGGNAETGEVKKVAQLLDHDEFAFVLKDSFRFPEERDSLPLLPKLVSRAQSKDDILRGGRHRPSVCGHALLGRGRRTQPMRPLDRRLRRRAAVKKVEDAQSVSRDLPDLISFLAATGCRIGEALALRAAEMSILMNTVQQAD